MPANDNRPTRLSILNPDGSVNRKAFDAVLASRIEAEINLQLCSAARLFVPSTIPYGDVEHWRAECVRQFQLGPVSAAEREKIEKYERAELEDWVAAMQRGAAHQRAAMGAHLQAAE